MVQWFVDKASKMPLYLQLKDQIEYYVSTGAIQDNHQLPPVHELAGTLGINFETVRKAYKELQQEGLLSMKRGQGTFITLHSDVRAKRNSQASQAAAETPSQPSQLDTLESVRRFVRQARAAGVALEELKGFFAQACAEALKGDQGPAVIFTECNALQVREISEYLKEQLQRPIQPLLLDDLGAALTRHRLADGRVLHVITTGFHVNEVRATIGKLAATLPENLTVNLDVLITNMSPDTRRQIDARGRAAKIGFICRDQESAQLYRDLLRVELDNNDLNLTCCTLAEQAQVQALYQTADVLLVSPPVYEEVRRAAPARLPIFNVFDRVDPMSLRVIKDRLNGQAINAAN